MCTSETLGAALTGSTSTVAQDGRDTPLGASAILTYTVRI